MYITSKHLSSYNPKKNSKRLSRKEIIINKFVEFFKDDSEYELVEFTDYQSSVFLSHKHDEGQILEMSVSLLKSLDVKVYIDWQDKQMPLETSRETAEKIKNKIKECSKFIFLATSSAVESKWCNWELGFGDSIKFPLNIAIMPIAEEDGTWKGYEYLDIYPIIKINTENEYYVEYNKVILDLKTWLTR